MRKILSIGILLTALTACGSDFSGPPASSTPTTTTVSSAPVSTTVEEPPPMTAEQTDDARFLSELAEAGIPSSDLGSAEVQIARGACIQLDKGAAPAALARDLVAMGVGWTEEQTLSMIAIARRVYDC